jgi:CBS domain containing-hemolysin-like protein
VGKSLGTTGMAAVAGQFHGAAGIAAVLAAILTVFRSLTIACRMSAFLSFRHRFLPFFQMMILLMDLFLNAYLTLTSNSLPVETHSGSYSDLHFTNGLEYGYFEQTRSSMVERVTRLRNNGISMSKHDCGQRGIGPTAFAVLISY